MAIKMLAGGIEPPARPPHIIIMGYGTMGDGGFEPLAQPTCLIDNGREIYNLVTGTPPEYIINHNKILTTLFQLILQRFLFYQV
jgi:hypothetical protein